MMPLEQLNTSQLLIIDRGKICFQRLGFRLHVGVHLRVQILLADLGLLLSSSASAAASCTATSAPAASAASAAASAAAERTLAAGTLPDAAAHGSPQRLGLQRLDTGHLDPHRSSVERNSVVLFQCCNIFYSTH